MILILRSEGGWSKILKLQFSGTEHAGGGAGAAAGAAAAAAAAAAAVALLLECCFACG